jgi:hypothetical protein
MMCAYFYDDISLLVLVLLYHSLMELVPCLEVLLPAKSNTGNLKAVLRIRIRDLVLF